MPVCEGLPYGPCPLKKNDKYVELGKGDLLLCSSCDTERRRLFDEESKSRDKERKNSVRTGSKSTASAVDSLASSRSGNSRKPQSTAPVTSISSSDSLQSQATNAPTYEPGRTSGVETVINELLTYVFFFIVIDALRLICSNL